MVVTAILLLYFGNLKYFLIYALVVSMHEMAHFFVSKKLGYKLSKMYIMPYGVCLNYKDNAFAENDEIYIALAGPLFNYLMCIICVCLWWLFPESYYYLDYFCFCNLILGSFNLIPCFPLDGGRVFISLFSKRYDREKVFNVSVWLNYSLSFVFILLFIITVFKGNINYSYIMIAIFLFSGCINPNKYSSYNYLSLGVNKKSLIKNGTNVKIFATLSSTPIYKIIAKFSKYKFNIVYVVFKSGKVTVMSEITLQSLAVKYSPALSINEIMMFK